MLSNSLPLIFKAGVPYTPCLYQNLPQKSSSITHVLQFSLVRRGLIPGSFSTRHKGSSSLVAFGAKNAGSGEEHNKALEAVLKLYTALRNRNITELSEVIGEECRCVCNFISIFQPFHGKKEVLGFFSTLMEYLGNNIQFVVQPSLHDGMNVGVSWKLEWKQTHVPLGKGYSFHMCHTYQGKVTIRNVEMFMEPLLHIEPLRLKLMGFVMTIVDKIGASKGKLKRAIYFLLALALMTALLFIV
ncbi:hypothetical protein RHSIM_Rhsim02G0099400 [Rhododendron simsii]|uniref:SnoaL-like domain-containing protein n=1 Tax=Rhododendron simsii TaxID=118357 RepID=A0A834HEX8_RHOSS|nr:hypothetical protein RHSIM_Rhsim02G0099400 [Rhododendron simsii]